MSENAPETSENKLSDNKDDSFVVNASLLCFHYSFHKDPKWKTNEYHIIMPLKSKFTKK